MRERYISLMSKTLGAYSDAHIKEYFEAVKNEGLTEHGFPRLTAGIGILIAHKKREDLLPLFCEMMSFCCENIPRVKAANDFSVREIIFCIMALEETDIISKAKISEWKTSLSSIVPEKCYNKYATSVTDKVNNWACFTAVSEFMREYIGLCDSSSFIDMQIANQLKYIDSNGMYRDPHEPAVYDLVPRLLFSVLLHFGYCGQYREIIDAHLKKAGLLTLKMQSVSGEIPFGGRSNQFIFNEALIAVIFEYEAARYFACGDVSLAKELKNAAKKALDNIEKWLSEEKIRHVKNFFPVETSYGCEGYAYFDKYMITVASYLYCAYLLCDDRINVSEGEIEERKPYAVSTSEHFHKHFMYAGGYFLEFDTRADKSYDCSGLGRVHRKGAPSALCMSLPCTDSPKYKINTDDASSLSLCVGGCVDGEMRFATDPDSEYNVTSLSADNVSAYAKINTLLCGIRPITSEYKVSEEGVEITVSGEGKLAFMLPVFSFDGEECTDITAEKSFITIKYKGWSCKYTTDGTITDLEKNAYNRNGYYRSFCAAGNRTLSVKVTVTES